MAAIKLLAVQAFFTSLFARLFTRKNFAQALSLLTVLGLVGTAFFISPDASATPADVGTKITAFEAEAIALLKTLLTAVISIGSAAIVIFLANTALRWLRGVA